MRRFALPIIFLLLITLFLTTGCAGRENAEEDTDSALVSGDKMAVASWEAGNTVLQSSSIMMGDTLYFTVSDWDEENKKLTDTSICRKQSGGSEETITYLAEDELIVYFVDESESIYYLYAKEGNNGINYYLKKISVDGKVCYDSLVSSQDDTGKWAVQRVGTVFTGEADREGNVCLCSTYGDLYLFDTKGQPVGLGEAPWNEDSYNSTKCGLVNAGEAGIFTYFTDRRKVSLQKVNVSDGKLESTEEVQAENQSSASLEIFNGYDMGILISDSDTLWKYNPANQQLHKVLGWGDSTVNLKDYMVDAIGILQDESLYVMVHKSYEDTAFVHIDYREEAPREKQVVTIAMIDDSYEYTNTELNEMVSVFNRQSTEYKVEFRSYASVTELEMALLKGEGPDLFDFGEGSADISILASNGVLENLSPYFAESDLVQEDDLLPSVRNAGTVNGELVCVFPTFYVYGIMVEKGTTNNGGWTPEEYIALAEKHPQSAMADYGDPAYYLYYVLQTAIWGDMENYINWEEKECYFDSERFISLLNRIKSLEVPKTTVWSKSNMEAGISMPELEKEKFLNRELLTSPSFTCGSIETFGSLKDDYGDFVEIAGYPNQSGEPCYRLDHAAPLGINSASQNKEGAWAFLEFLLSEEYQSSVLTTFPVRQDAFESHMALEETHLAQIDLSDEEREFIRYMVDNAYWFDAWESKDFDKIIAEETDAVWAGDKTAEDAARIIQNRIELFLKEQTG